MNLPEQLLDKPFTCTDAYASGLSRSDLQKMVRGGKIRRLARNLYVRDPLQLDTVGRAKALSLVIARHHVITDRTAAWIHGVDTYDYPGEHERAKVEASALPDHTRARRPELACGTRDLWPADVVSIGGVAVTSPARTALDLACKLKPMSALACVEAFLRKGVTQGELAAMLPRFKGRRGVRLAREVVAIASGRVESEGESFTKMVVHRAGLSLPSEQVWVNREDGTRLRIDFAYEALKIALEYDGEEFHGPAQRAADEERRTWLRQHGWYVIVVRKEDLNARAAERWIAELREVLAERTGKVEHYSRFARV